MLVDRGINSQHSFCERRDHCAKSRQAKKSSLACQVLSCLPAVVALQHVMERENNYSMMQRRKRSKDKRQKSDRADRESPETTLPGNGSPHASPRASPHASPRAEEARRWDERLVGLQQEWIARFTQQEQRWDERFAEQNEVVAKAQNKYVDLCHFQERQHLEWKKGLQEMEKNQKQYNKQLKADVDGYLENLWQELRLEGDNHYRAEQARTDATLEERQRQREIQHDAWRQRQAEREEEWRSKQHALEEARKQFLWESMEVSKRQLDQTEHQIRTRLSEWIRRYEEEARRMKAAIESAISDLHAPSYPLDAESETSDSGDRGNS
eukprot:GHVU01191131.1.p1 GENE.GHVU01191131.1~~GHVU01191131.1.p1  ORF type:complete len:325 (+),score=47.02 GHVU01191131.1:92-1066(+)